MKTSNYTKYIEMFDDKRKHTKQMLEETKSHGSRWRKKFDTREREAVLVFNTGEQRRTSEVAGREPAVPIMFVLQAQTYFILKGNCTDQTDPVTIRVLPSNFLVYHVRIS